MKPLTQHHKEVLKCINNNYTSLQFNATTLFELMNISPEYVRRICKAHFGKTPQQLIRDIRITKAIELIQANGRNNFCCKDVGFYDVRTFKKALQEFKQEHHEIAQNLSV
ncbi:MAG: helix-turn-helix domain-containing protein [Candidatus Kapaibacterium sp.]|nr:helix-turn-helix domain-containing protein [Bacteroidota bacterium]